MGFNKKFFTTGGIVASTPPAAAAFDPLQNFETVTYTGNGSTQKITGYIRKGAAFNGSSSEIIIPSLFSNPNTNSSTLSLWFKTSINDANLRTIFTARDFATNSYDIYTINGVIRLAHEGNLGGNGVVNGTTTVTDGQWHHMAVVLNNSAGTLNIYLDGSTTADITLTFTSNASLSLFGSQSAFGALPTPNIRYFNGSIDQVRIFNKALDSGEVGQLALETYADPKKSTTDYFDDGSGVALYELDGDANDTGRSVDSGQSASFTNTNQNYIQLPSGIDTILNTKNFGLSFWVKAPNAATDAVFSTETTNSTFQIHANWGFAGAYSLINGGGSDINLGAVDSNWHHIVVTSDGSSSYKGYFDKSYKGASTYRQTSNVGTFLGSHPSGGFNLEGQIDQVRIFNRQLSQSDIDSLYNETSPSTVDYFGDGNGKALYKLDNTPDDESGSYNATWNGTAAYIDEAANVKYDGTPTNVNFLGMAFQPDFVWIKNRTASFESHMLYDSIRTATKAIQSDTTAAESTRLAGLTSFDSNGFTVGSGGAHNQLNAGLVAWCWKAGGSSNTYNVDDTGYSTASDAGLSSANVTTLNGASVNTQAGFSIINYETNVNGDNRPAHGLTQEPELIIFKPYDTSSLNWYVMTKKIDGSLDFLFLNTTDTKIDAGTNEFIDSTHFRTSFGTVWGSIIAYCFHSVDGYQRVGTYLGSGVSGKRVYTTDDGTPTGNGGFRPRFVMYKLSSSSGHSWVMIDDVRSPSNPRNKYLLADSSGQEGTTNVLNFTDDGFELLLTDLGTNALDETYIYLAIA
jgi:hypothetical protein